MSNKLTIQDFNYPLDELLEYLENPNICVSNVTKQAYLFSNENLKEYFSKFNFNGKSVATVGSSGDQALNAVYYGSNRVVVIDGNPLSKSFIELKIAAIKNLDFSEFIDFYVNKNISDYRTYSKISHDLSVDSKMFWDQLYLEMDNKELKNFVNDAIQEHFSHVARKCDSSIFYKNEKAYNKLQGLIDNVKIDYLCADITDFSKVLGDEKFDYIFLSNILDYSAPIKFFDTVAQLQKNNLNQNGKIQINYSFLSNAGFTLVEGNCDKELNYKNLKSYRVDNIMYNSIDSVMFLE